MGSEMCIRDRGTFNPLKPALQQGGGNGIKTSLGHVDFTSSQHQPGLNRSLETNTLQRIKPHKDRGLEQNVAQLLRQSVAAVECWANSELLNKDPNSGCRETLLSSR